MYLSGYETEGEILGQLLKIPNLSDDELYFLYKNIKPIITIDGIKYNLSEYTLEELRNKPFLYNIEEYLKSEINENEIETLEDYLCLHKDIDKYNQTIAEILGQMPNYLTKTADAFEIIEIPLDTQDVCDIWNITNAGYTVSKVRTYKLH